MRKQTKVLVAAFVVAISLAAVPTLFAQDSRDHGMMGSGGMMGMMRQMSQMMDHCGQMMSGNRDDGGRPNDQWRKQAPVTPQRND